MSPSLFYSEKKFPPELFFLNKHKQAKISVRACPLLSRALSRQRFSINLYVIVNRNVSYNSRDSVTMTQNGTNPAAGDDILNCSRTRESFSLSGILTLKHLTVCTTHCPLSRCQFHEQSAEPARIHPASNQHSRSVSRWWDGSSRNVYVHRVNRTLAVVSNPSARESPMWHIAWSLPTNITSLFFFPILKQISLSCISFSSWKRR